MADNKEIITIYKVDTGEAVTNIKELKDNIAILKERLNDANQTFEKNAETAEELRLNQDALKRAMNATSSSVEQITEAAKHQGESYNSLVRQMGEYKRILRTIDTSTEAGKKEFADLADKINDVNDKLKAMDKLQGNFKRNVGNYQTAIKGLGENIEGLVKVFKATQGSAEGATAAVKALSNTPALVIFGLLASAVANLASNFKDTEEGAESVQAAMVNLKPIMDFFRGLIAKLSDIIGDLLVKVSEFIGTNGVFNKVVDGIVGVGNAIYQFISFPIKQTIESVKGLGKILKDIFTGNFKDLKADAEAFSKGIQDTFTKGISFKANFQKGKQMGEDFIAGISSTKVKKKAHDTGKEIGAEVANGIAEGLTKDEILKNLAIADKALDEARKARQQENAELTKETEEMWEETNDAIDEYINSEIEAQFRLAQEEQEILKMRQENYLELATCVGDIFGAIASYYDTDAKESEKAFENSKKFQLAEAWVNTLTGMVAAVRSVWSDKTIPSAAMKVALAAANAGAVLASGLASVNKIKSTSFGGGEVGSAPQVAVASVSAPNIQASLPQMVQLTGVPTEQTSKVYILQSDIEAAGNKAKVRDSESSLG